ncbi:hypothetical protein BDV59DRAFT_16770 [Aspergillus ambiguus]|uniref:YdeI/OmpD-associated family protein n=1 Tax=Aspergillus ambiguus TaxID=176160 RepID=UPI003CCD8813
MAPRDLPSDLPIHSFPSVLEMENFLEREHSTSQGIWVKLAKKASGIRSISAQEAVEVALCFGWIDGRANSYDHLSWLVRFTPRRPKSLWSKKNVISVQRLIEDGRMRPAGLAVVESAKADGRWGRAYDGVTIPDDLAAALRTEPAAAAALDNMPQPDRYSALLRIQMASPQTRANHISALIQRISGRIPNSSRKRKNDPTSTSRNLPPKRKKG